MSSFRGKETHVPMKSSASFKKCCAALLATALIFACAVASAQTYRLGDEADEIATIQTALKQLKLYSAELTGHFGSKTEAAVKAFQKKNGLVADGVAGDETIAALYEAAGITDLGSTGGSSGGPSSGSGALLRYDSSGDAVLKLQKDLNALGYYDGSLSGHFGTKTEAAVMNFQRKNGLSADGIAGSKTLALIASALGGSSSSSSSSGSSGSSSSSSSSSSSTLLKYGMKSSDAVRTLQQNLKSLGYYSTGSVTGNFGKLTKDAVYTFQRDHGLSADGIAGAKTLSAIASALGGSSSSSGSTSSSGSSSSASSSSGQLSTSVTLQKNSKSDEVLKLQKALKSLGFYTGNLTGNFGSVTADAVTAYQRSKGLTADGIAGSRTLTAINADLNGNTGVASKNSGTDVSALAQKVVYSNFYNWRRKYANGEYCTVYDFATGYSWRLRIMTKDAHMDAEPVTAEDTATMLKAFGGKTTWTPKAVWVTFSDGTTYIGSTHDVPHETYHIGDNNFKGHLCVHFPLSMETANSIGDYATSHQEAIDAGWEQTKKLRY